MKSSCVCPKCKGQRFYVIEKPLCGPPGSLRSDSVVLGVAHHEAPTGNKGLFEPTMATFVAPLEAWVCAECAYTELYTRYLSVLEHLAKHDEDIVRVVNAETGEQGAFR